MKFAHLFACVLLLPTIGVVVADDAHCTYEVEVDENFALDVTVQCDRAVTGLRSLDRFAAGYVEQHANRNDGDAFETQYRVELGAIASASRSIDTALRVGNSIIVVGAAWILEPVRASERRGSIAIRVSTPSSVDFVTAQPLNEGWFEIPESQIEFVGYAALGRFDRHPMQAPGAGNTVVDYEVIVLDGPMDVARKDLLAWVDRMSVDAAGFWHGFPAPDLKIFVVPRDGASGVPFGRDMSGGGISTVLIVGEHATLEELYDDWVLVHELVHLGTPFITNGPWMSEGLATYLEPLIRARTGLQTPHDMWTEFIQFMPRGEAVINSTGLSRGGFRGWYWGGAMLYLLADVELRRESGGRVGLEHCLRAVRERLGSYVQSIDIETFARTCDEAVGGTVLSDLVARHVYAVNPVSLDELWAKLGLSLDGNVLRVSDAAVWSAVRNSIIPTSVQ